MVSWPSVSVNLSSWAPPLLTELSSEVFGTHTLRTFCICKTSGPWTCTMWHILSHSTLHYHLSLSISVTAAPRSLVSCYHWDDCSNTQLHSLTGSPVLHWLELQFNFDSATMKWPKLWLDCDSASIRLWFGYGVIVGEYQRIFNEFDYYSIYYLLRYFWSRIAVKPSFWSLPLQSNDRSRIEVKSQY